jgi:hypothetical protein
MLARLFPLALTGAIYVVGLFDLMLGITFFLNPQVSAAGAGFSIAPLNLTGLATIRADMTAFFLVSGVAMMWGAWRRNADLLVVPTALFGVALAIRVLTALTMGTGPQYLLPIIVEAVHFVLLLAAWKVLPHHKLAEMG